MPGRRSHLGAERVSDETKAGIVGALQSPLSFVDSKTAVWAGSQPSGPCPSSMPASSAPNSLYPYLFAPDFGFCGFGICPLAFFFEIIESAHLQ